MVLKRLLVTTLGALGLGALAAGPASAQQVPAPDLFDGQVACSSNVPAGMANGPLATALAEVVMDGDLIAADSAGVPVAESPVAGLNYIIPPGDNNCGGGDATYSDDDVTAAEMGGGMAGFEAGDLKTTVTGAIATDVATGYSETLTAYLASRTEDAAVKAASTALNTLLTDATEDGLQTAMITAARETLAAAETKRAAAHAKLYSVGAGPINMAGIAEWRAKFAVEDAVKAWNTAVGELGAAEMLLNPMDYAEYVPVTSTQLLGLLEMGTINLAELRTYANAEGMNTSVQDAMDGTVDGDSAFDGAGNLIVPMELWDHDMDGATDMVLRPDQDSMTYMQVKERLDEVGDVVEALEKLQADNKNALLTPVITEGVRRAKVEQAHYQAQFAAMVADTTDINNDVNTDDNTDNDVAVISLNSRYAEYTAAETTRDNMGVGLTTAFQAREMATSAVAAAFTNSQAFYQQLVDRREFTKAAAEAEVTRLAGLTGDDAATDAQTTAAATAVTTAQTALDTATEAQAAFQDLIAEGSPVADLVNELLKSDAIGDDGGELVDAIAGAYEGQDAAAERLDELLRDEITTTPQLDADGNAVTNADGIPQRTEVVTELGRVKTLEDRVDALADDETVAGNTADIAANKEEIGGNTNAIDQLEVNLDAEVADRIAGDVALGVLIEDEKAARVATRRWAWSTTRTSWSTAI